MAGVSGPGVGVMTGAAGEGMGGRGTERSTVAHGLVRGGGAGCIFFIDYKDTVKNSEWSGEVGVGVVQVRVG